MLAVALLCIGALSDSAAQTRESDLFEARSFKLPSTTMYYRLFKPKDFDPSKKYPIVTALHGGGERGSDNRVQVDREDLAHPWIEDSVQARVPHFILVPQCPANMWWWSSNTGKGPISEPSKGLVDLLDSLKKEFPLDTNRIYLQGLSVGGLGTWDLLRLRPGYFTAAAPCAGLGDVAFAGDVSRTAVWAFHGEVDPTVALSLDGTSPKMMDAFEKLGKKVVRFVSQAPFNGKPSLTDYSNALKSGTDPLKLVALNPSGISWDSLARAVKGGSDFLYSLAAGGDHRTGWMIAFHNPLLPTWMFSKTKDRGSVTLAPRLKARRGKEGNLLILEESLPDGIIGGWSPLGRRMGAAGTAGIAPILLIRPAP